MFTREIWINVKTTKVTVDGQLFTVRTDVINRHGMQKVVDHIRQHFKQHFGVKE